MDVLSPRDTWARDGWMETQMRDDRDRRAVMVAAEGPTVP